MNTSYLHRARPRRSRSLFAKSTRSVVAAGMFTAIGLGLASCSSSSTTTSAPTSTSSAAASASQSAYSKYTACLAAHGVTFAKYSSSSTPPTTVSAATRQAAQAACSSDLPSGAHGFRAYGGFNGKNLSPAAKAELTKYTACLAAHGVTFAKFKRPASVSGSAAGYAPVGAGGGSPRPGASAGGSGHFHLSSAEAAKIKAAMAACASLRPKVPTPASTSATS